MLRRDQKPRLTGASFHSSQDVAVYYRQRIHPRDSFKAAIRESAAAVIFMHDHPSGDIKPCEEDILLTRRLVQAGEVLGIRVLDHIIISDCDHFSFWDNGMIQQTS